MCVRKSRSLIAPYSFNRHWWQWALWRRGVGVKVSTYDQHRRPHHLRDTLPEFSSGARFTQTPRKFPGLRMHRSGHRYASLGINYRPIHAFYQQFTGNSSSAYPRLRPPLVRTTSLKLGHVVVWPLVRRSYSSIQFSFSKINTCRIAPELCLLLSGIVDTIKCPLE